jgi:hypothetical protein
VYSPNDLIMTNSMNVENYIVRIYRRSRSGMLVGIVENAESGWQKPFRSVEELTDIITSPKHRSGWLKNVVTETQSKGDENLQMGQSENNQLNPNQHT